jgi:hypothetical protein
MSIIAPSINSSLFFLIRTRNSILPDQIGILYIDALAHPYWCFALQSKKLKAITLFARD